MLDLDASNHNPTMYKTYLDLVSECDNFPYYTDDRTRYSFFVSNYYAFKVHTHSQPIGHIPKPLVELFGFDFPRDAWKVDHERRELILSDHCQTHALPTEYENRNGSARQDEAERQRKTHTALMHKTLVHISQLSTNPIFTSLRRNWRDETFPIYGSNGCVLLEIERSASALFGILTAGVQMTAYTRDSNGEIWIWIARRSKHKQTYPRMLDNTAAGGLESGMVPLEGVVREAVQEASLDEGSVRRGISCAGALSYYHVTGPIVGSGTDSDGEVGIGLLQPEIEYMYEIELAAGVAPTPGDSEVEEFYLWNVEEVASALRSGEFKWNSGVVLIDFFMRHGILTAENEADYIEIGSRLRRRLKPECFGEWLI